MNYLGSLTTENTSFDLVQQDEATEHSTIPTVQDKESISEDCEVEPVAGPSKDEDQKTELSSKRKTWEDHLHAEIPVHSIVLCLNSCYFQKLFIESGMKENNMTSIDIKVNQGEGQYLELLIKAFYDESTLESLPLPDLLSVMDIAARFSCTSFVDYGLELLDKKTVKTFDECNTILQCVSRVFSNVR